MSTPLTKPAEVVGNLITSTWYSVIPKTIDSAFQVTPLYDVMMKSGKIKEKTPDGTHFEIPIRYSKQDQNRKWFGRADEFGVAEKESLTRLMYYVRNVGTSLLMVWDDVMKNRSKAKIIDYVDEMVENAKLSMIDGFEEDLFVQNTDSDSMHALQTLLPTDPTSGSIAGHTRSGQTFLQHNVKDFAGLTTEVNLLNEMDRMVNLCSIHASGTQRRTNMIITTREIYQDLEIIARAMQVIQTSTSSRVSLGFGNITYKGIEIYWAPRCPSGVMYFLNTENLILYYDPSAWFQMTEWKSLPKGLDKIAQVVCRCQLVCDQFRKQGLIYSITTTSS